MAMKALALVEHVDRELDLLCLVRMLLRKYFSITLEISQNSADAPSLLNRRSPPKIVFFSSFYSSQWPLCRDYISAWPGAKIVSLAWEQIFCPIDVPLHLPLDAFARDHVHYLAWSTDYRDFLTAHGVNPANIAVVGHSLYGLYDQPYSDYFLSKREIARKHHLNVDKKWVFIPENSGFAFRSEEFLRNVNPLIMSRKNDSKKFDLFELRRYCRSETATLSKWANELARRSDMEVIFRPRPAVDAAELSKFFREDCGIAEPAFRLIKEETTRDWVLASDAVISSYSTVLIEAALAGKKVLRIEPSTLPDALRFDWCDLIPSITCLDELNDAVSADAFDSASAALRKWAKARFFGRERPIFCLVKEIASQTTAAHNNSRAPVRGLHNQKMPMWLSLARIFVRANTRDKLYRRFVPNYTHKVSGHERDLFDAQEVRRRTQRWNEILSKRLPAAINPPARLDAGATVAS
jgi:surface carbohydrate biosynthesis protein